MDLLATHPWPSEYAEARKLEWRWTVDVPAPADRMWPLLADLSRLNHALRLPAMTFEERDGARIGRARYTGVLHEWIEVPWNWVAGRWYELVRIYRKGSMRALHGIVELEPHDAGTRIHVYYGVVPRSRIFDVGLQLSFRAMRRAYRRLLPRIAEEAMREPAVPACLQEPRTVLRPEASERLEQVSATLGDSGVDAEHVRRLVEWVRTAEDAALERIRVIERARAWSIGEDELLRTCLHATRAGLLQLTWDVICPHCRGVRESPSELARLPAQVECAACGIRFGSDSSDAVEITFHTHASIRPVRRGVYCSAEPAHKPHILVQHLVSPGATVEVLAPAQPDRYRLRLRGEMHTRWLEVAPSGDAPRALELDTGAMPDTARLAPGGTLRVTNSMGEPHTVIIEIARWLEHALRPGRLLSFQEFRDLFSGEYLATGVQIAVGEQTILFTDVVGSTAMYAERGDSTAFVEVKRHFDAIFEIVAAHRGAVVKTIGDATMAAFHDPLDAIRAAQAIHTAFPPGRGDDALRVRVSLNTGPCIAVRLNTEIDYFGHTVNLAAKLQSAAGAWQVAVGETTLAAPGVGAWLAEHGAALEEVEIALKGVSPAARAKRWTVA